MIVIQNSINLAIDAKSLTQHLKQIMVDLHVQNSELLLRFVDAQEMIFLNKTYRKQNKTTNVLSFPSNLPIEIDEEILGDIVICPEIIIQEAKEQDKSFHDHLLHIIVHGLLHLLGYNHIDDMDAQKMQNLEVKILKTINISNPYQ